MRLDISRLGTLLETLLNEEKDCLYVHCKSEEDRSAVTLYALFRLRFHFSAEYAAEALKTRLRINGAPVVNLTRDQDVVLEWITEVIDGLNIYT